MRYVYFDTCAFMRYAEGRVPQPDPRDAGGRGIVQALIDGTATLATSEVALIEFHDALGRRTRDGTRPDFDAAWFASATMEIMQLVANNRLAMVPVPPKAIDSAMGLMTLAHRDHGIAFHAWDAVHVITALAWAIDMKSEVELATCDVDFTRFFARFPHFEPWVRPLMVA